MKPLDPSLAAVPAAGVLLWGFLLGPLAPVGQGLLLLALYLVPGIGVICLMGGLSRHLLSLSGYKPRHMTLADIQASRKRSQLRRRDRHASHARRRKALRRLG